MTSRTKCQHQAFDVEPRNEWKLKENFHISLKHDRQVCAGSGIYIMHILSRLKNQQCQYLCEGIKQVLKHRLNGAFAHLNLWNNDSSSFTLASPLTSPRWISHGSISELVGCGKPRPCRESFAPGWSLRRSDTRSESWCWRGQWRCRLQISPWWRNPTR